jgi:hypothetical protein
MTNLSPAAQAVLDAYVDEDRAGRLAVAAALRAAADQVVPLRNAPKIAIDAWRPTVQWHVWDVQRRARADLLAIANELEAMTDFRSQPAADGEVAELVEWLRGANWDGKRQSLATRAAELLERLSPPQPIPVSERLPELKDCAPWSGTSDASVWCWVGSDFDYGWKWQQRSTVCLRAFPDDYTHWLPAHALPLPTTTETNND